MITEEMLCAAAARSCELYTADLESGYNADVLHEFSPAFEKKIRKLKRRADHPAFYRTMNRVASILLAILIAIGAWISVDTEAIPPLHLMEHRLPVRSLFWVSGQPTGSLRLWSFGKGIY